MKSDNCIHGNPRKKNDRNIILLIVLLFSSLVARSTSLNHDSTQHRRSERPFRTGLHEHEISRRILLASIAPILSAASALSCGATGEGEERMVLTQKPTAPRGALIPALQQRILLEECVILSKSLVENTAGVNKDHTLEKLKTIIAPLSNNNPTIMQKQPNFNLEPLPNQQYLQGNVVRVAINLYTSNLRIENNLPSYTVTDPAWKKSYIRQNDGLPDTSKVLQADMDLRDLYRNSIVTYLDDASAELYFKDVDLVELNQLLTQGALQFDLWLGRIDEAEVKVELQTVLEGKTPKIFKSYFAGFVPPK